MSGNPGSGLFASGSRLGAGLDRTRHRVRDGKQKCRVICKMPSPGIFIRNLRRCLGPTARNTRRRDMEPFSHVYFYVQCLPAPQRPRVHPGEYKASRVSERKSTCYDVGPSLRPTSFLYSGSSRRQSRSESLAAQFLRPYPAANAFLSVSSASAFFPRTPYVHAAL